MCLVAFAINASARWPFVLASNRDEFLDRPTLPLAKWKTAAGQEIISGRDGRAGGTWLGITPGGRVAFLTNVREPKCEPGLSSRGELVTRWLEGDSVAEEFSALLQRHGATYSGFNLVLGDLQRNAWTWLTNRSAISNSGWLVQALPAGLYGLSNAALDTPWPKTLELKRVLSTALLRAEKRDDLSELLWPALARRARMPPAGTLPIDIFQALDLAATSAFVDSPEYAYGTRSSAVLVVGSHNDRLQDDLYWIEMHERTYLRDGDGDGGTTMRFDTNRVLI